LVWLAWSGQQLPENLRAKVEIVHKPLSRQRLINLCRSSVIEFDKALPPFKLKGRVLLVDDNAINLKAMYGQLSNMGLHVDQANNGALALHLCNEYQYDLILMDVQMPDMDGLEATRRIHQLLHDQTPPIIGISAHVMDSDYENAQQAGMADYLSKPISKAALQTSLSRYLT
jgi:CheY-like chemotaxis protein